MINSAASIVVFAVVVVDPDEINTPNTKQLFIQRKLLADQQLTTTASLTKPVVNWKAELAK